MAKQNGGSGCGDHNAGIRLAVRGVLLFNYHSLREDRLINTVATSVFFMFIPTYHSSETSVRLLNAN